MSNIDTEMFRQQLIQKKEQLEEDLSTVGQINPDNPDDWEAVADDLNVLPSDLNELSDAIEEFEENTAVLKQLEIQLADVERALEKIRKDDKEYGVCEIGDEPIDTKRLEVYPAARACVQHAGEIEASRF